MAKDPYKTALWARTRKRVLERDNYRCQIRGPSCKGEASEVDHIIPIEDGGDVYDPSNLRAACHPCNSRRANAQKEKHGWRRADATIVLVVGPIAAGKSTYVQERAGPDDVVVDYDALSQALGPALDRGHGGIRHEATRTLRNHLLRQIQRGELKADRIWIISSNPEAERIFPHHEVVIVDPGMEVVLERAQRERPDALHWLIHEWYMVRAGQQAEAEAVDSRRDW